MVGNIILVLLEIYCSLQQWKNFANRSRIDKVRLGWHPFLTHGVYINCHIFLLKFPRTALENCIMCYAFLNAFSCTAQLFLVLMYFICMSTDMANKNYQNVDEIVDVICRQPETPIRYTTPSPGSAMYCDWEGNRWRRTGYASQT